ncbi:WD40 repeat-like protein [Annulohypoxylon maeteangense]|uniref:WD40 repeat-like protein n=1 Tax=Annulohypoxylon maeteangense TaxID=1927788 RepID=UPI00200838D3|nr:WD40 repeat-like protein [Annulohypoxylon maeteangense]KAI0885406.1 WD40 repeat-like protein [Annulohypoxylon maeteangense]
MDPFSPAQEPDEGYSEHPLNPSDPASLVNNGSLTAKRSPADIPAWLSAQLPTLSVHQKSRLAMLILNELPTTVIADIVMNELNPRLYINFVERLPPEICLKILGYLDPVSLIYVAMSCRGWYDLAIDRKLWERLFYLEGWKAIPSEIIAAEQRMNENLSSQISSQKAQSFEDGHVNKKRAISDSTPQDDEDYEMVDADASVGQEPATNVFNSAFSVRRPGESGSSFQSNTSVTQHMGNLMMKSPSPMPDFGGQPTSQVTKGKGKATVESLELSRPFFEVPAGLPSLPKSTLWIYDTRDRRYKINWKYMYTMRRRLERNWDRGRFANFQLPHPDHLDEGHNECIYSLQYNSDYLVSGSRDRTLRIWNLRTRRLIRRPLGGHQGSVLCLQFDSDPDEDLIVSGSSDSDVILWKFSTGEIIQRLRKAHRESVLNVKFDKRILVTCSKDKTIKIFNRVPLRPGDLGYGSSQGVSPVPINLRNYGFDDSPLNQAAIKQPYTMIACLEGHGAAVNAVQICDREIVSASGDRHIKVWDWPNQICQRTFLGHNKGIACVQYDGRRIVSGSSDNEVKVFDRETGLEVASLRGHTNLVRTVQAGFGDLPYSVEQDRLDARAVDQAYFKALNAGDLQDMQSLRRRPHNAGSRRPEDITAYGAKLPPGGGGGPYGRIVSGSYDQSIIIWRRDREGVWRNAHTLRQEEGAAAALRQCSSSSSRATAPSTSNRNLPTPPAGAPSALPQTHPNYTHIEHPIIATITPQTTSSYTQMIDNCVPQGPAALEQALAAYPTMLTYQHHIQAAIERETNALVRSQLRQVVNTALVRAQIAQNRARESIQRALSATSGAGEASTSQPGHPSTRQADQPTSPRQLTTAVASSATVSAGHGIAGSGGGPPPTIANITTPHVQQHNQQAQSQPQVAAPQPQAQAQGQQQQHPHIAQADTSPARIFKLQFDARRIICCSQTSTIVGWDFCNGDPELEEAAVFFGTVE